MSSFETIKNKILNETDAYKRHPFDLYAITLMNDIKKSTNFSELLNSFYSHSKFVYHDSTACDYLNGCDGDLSPLSIFIYQVIKNEYVEDYNFLLSTIQTEQDYLECEWVLNELNMLLWTNPIEYRKQIELFIQHPILGPHFTFASARWTNPDYYSSFDLNLDTIDEMYLHFFKLYKEKYLTSTTNKYICNQYITDMKEDLTFRYLSYKELPKLYAYMYTSK